MTDTILTREGYDKLVSELEYLREVKRVEVADRLRAAIEGGGDDLLENAELEAARNEQSFVEGRIDDIAFLIANAKIMDSSLVHGTVQVGAVIEIQEEGEEDTETYSIVGAPEADASQNRISNESPIGKAVLGHKAGDTVEVSAPAGSYRIKILKVK